MREILCSRLYFIKGLFIGKYCLNSYDEELVYAENCFIRMLQNYSTVHYLTCVSEKIIILSPIIRSTPKIKKTILHERGGAGISSCSFNEIFQNLWRIWTWTSRILVDTDHHTCAKFAVFSPILLQISHKTRGLWPKFWIYFMQKL